MARQLASELELTSASAMPASDSSPQHPIDAVEQALLVELARFPLAHVVGDERHLPCRDAEVPHQRAGIHRPQRVDLVRLDALEAVAVGDVVEDRG